MKRVFLILLLLPAIKLSAQSALDNPTMVDLNVPSPQVAALGKYGEESVDMHTGVPQINIPLYVVSYPGIQLPVSLSYDASGIKVSSIASSVGQNWSLIAGGSISRVIRGKPDEVGYFTSSGANMIPSNAATNSISDATTIGTFRSSAGNIIDCQPDEYLFNFNGINGKFVLDKNQQPHFIPFADIKVESHIHDGPGTPSYFKLTTDDGKSYFFEALEKVITENCSSVDPNTGGLQITAWHLTKIVLPNGIDNITLQYDTELLEQTAHSFSDVFGPVPGASYSYSGLPSYQGNYSPCTINTSYFQQRISRIIFPTGKVEFTYGTQRTDLSGSQPNYALTNVSVYALSNTAYTKIKEYRLQQGYYGISGNQRLRLDKIIQAGTDGSTQDLYSFSYNTTMLPGYQSYAQDHWGYYNGATGNTNLLPNDIIVNGRNVPGGDRNVNPGFSNAGILQKIVYPTGGYTEFEFENNSYGYECTGDVNENLYQTLTATVTSACTGQTLANSQHTANFVIDHAQYVNFSSYINNNSGTTPCTGAVYSTSIHCLTGADPTLNAWAGNLLYLNAGTYQITAIANCSDMEIGTSGCQVSAGITVTYTKITGTTKNKYAGGLRVTKITSTPNYDGQPVVKEYDYSLPYETDRSSGALQFKPEYQYTYTLSTNSSAGWSGSGGTSGQQTYCGTYTAAITVVSSGAQNTGLFQTGQPVAYRYVREKSGTNGSNGSVLYQFSFTTTQSCDAAMAWPFIPGNSYKHRNGLTLATSTYDAAGTLVHDVHNNYHFEAVDFVPGWKAMNFAHDLQCPNFDKFSASYYKYQSEKIILDNTTETNYYSTGSPVSKVTSYYYDNAAHTKPTKIETILNQDGWWLYNRYAKDFTISSGSTGLAGAIGLLQQNNNNALIEQYKAKNISGAVNVTQSSLTSYQSVNLSGNTVPLPDKSYQLETTTPLNNYAPLPVTLPQSGAVSMDNRMKLRESVSSYDAHGNAVDDNVYGVLHTLILSPDGATITAEVSNAIQAQVAYCSFEADETGNWHFPAAGISTAGGVTGNKCYNLASGNVTSSTLPGGDYLISYWSKSGSALVNGNGPAVTGGSFNGWTYYEHAVSAGTITVSGSALIDELRLYPANAQMKTYTYQPLVGTTAECDAANHILYYEYDPYGRLVLVRDQAGNIIKKADYAIQKSE
ncbi:hypothetical protein ACTHGU_04790 [Chitinophagaceae bacterium MMS25-I14]